VHPQFQPSLSSTEPSGTTPSRPRQTHAPQRHISDNSNNERRL
jgi:hypothetical protein